MSRLIERGQLAILLLGPAVIALCGGGYGQKALLWSGIAVWSLVVIGALIRRDPLPGSFGARTALIGLTALGIFTAISLNWTPVRSGAKIEIERLLLYVGALTAAIPALRSRSSARMVEPAVLLASAATALWGMSERLAPSLFTLGSTPYARGRLAEPLGYWNAVGGLSALGLVITARIVGDRERSTLTRAVAATCAPLLGCSLWLSYSRGSLAALAGGLILLVVFVPQRSQLKAIALTIAVSIPAALVADRSDAIRLLSGTGNTRNSAGIILLVVLTGMSALAAAAVVILNRRDGSSIDRPSENLSPRFRHIAAVIAAVVLVAPIVGILAGTPTKSVATNDSIAGSSRLASTDSDRGLYWEVATDTFGKNLIDGAGAASYRFSWAQGPYAQLPVTNAHSLELETASELGLLGLLALGMFICGSFVAGRRSLRRDSGLAAGAAAGGLLILAHTSIDWDWQIPGLILPALLLVALLLASAEPPPPDSRRLPARLLVSAVAVLAGLWLWHDWRAVVLQKEASTKIEAARILGFTPERYAAIDSRLRAAEWLNPDSAPTRTRALAMMLDGRPNEAVTLLERLIVDDNADYYAYALLANAYFQAGNHQGFLNAERAMLLLRPLSQRRPIG